MYPIRKIALSALVGGALFLGTATPAFAQNLEETPRFEANTEEVAIPQPEAQDNIVEATPTEEVITPHSEDAAEATADENLSIEPTPHPALPSNNGEATTLEVEAASELTTSASLPNEQGIASPLARGSYWVSSYFGGRCIVAPGSGTYHSAVDMAANENTPIYASANGVVTDVIQPSLGDAGYVFIDYTFPNGRKVTMSYVHMWEPGKYAKVGMKVKAGQLIALVGSSGISNGDHLHLSVYENNKLIDPISFFSSYGIDIVKDATFAVANSNATNWCSSYAIVPSVLRTQPNAQAEIIKEIAFNEKVYLWPEADVNGFVKAKLPSGANGYIYSNTFNGTLNESLPKINVKEIEKNRYRLFTLQYLSSHPSHDITLYTSMYTVKAKDWVVGTGRMTQDGLFTEVTFERNKTGWVVTPSLQSFGPAETETPPISSSNFADIPSNHKFAKEIDWMYTSGLSTGIKETGGNVVYRDKESVTREAMAAFLYRMSGVKNYKAPKTSPFIDVKPTDKFYTEISWLKEKGVTSGVKQANGKLAYNPKASVTREAMAAFLYRIDASPKANSPKKAPFIDVTIEHKFAKEIAWMYDTGLSTGVKKGNGTFAYDPNAPVTREAMAAFLYRSSNK